MDEDADLMMELKKGSGEAFDKLVEKYSTRIINYIYRFTNSREDAQDLAQEVFIRVYNAAKTYVPSAKFTTWLYRMASNISIDYIRKIRSKGPHESLDDRVENDDKSMHKQVPDEKILSPDKAIEEAEKAEKIKTALQYLPTNQRAAIILKIYDDCSYTEIARILGTSKASVESLILRARQELKERIKNI